MCIGGKLQEGDKTTFQYCYCFLCGPDFYLIQWYYKCIVLSQRNNRTVDKSNGSVNIKVLFENWGGNCDEELGIERNYWIVYIA